MSPPLQSIVALAVVALAATWLVRRALAKKKNPGCGGDCGCAAPDAKFRIAKNPRP
ncbi:MAG: FeoB-associated Cys-rich membrane protein [Opitutus sp.]|nr:FeoB-associated Cys-rich membrane protein [Opitutus sp.]